MPSRLGTKYSKLKKNLKSHLAIASPGLRESYHLPRHRQKGKRLNKKRVVLRGEKDERK